MWAAREAAYEQWLRGDGELTALLDAAMRGLVSAFADGAFADSMGRS